MDFRSAGTLTLNSQPPEASAIQVSWLQPLSPRYLVATAQTKTPRMGEVGGPVPQHGAWPGGTCVSRLHSFTAVTRAETVSKRGLVARVPEDDLGPSALPHC